MKHFNIKDSIEFDNFKCVGLVLDAKFYDDLENEPIVLLSFIQMFEVEAASIDTAIRPKGVFKYTGNPIMYQLLVGNKKGWISRPELASVLSGGSI